ncbi:hypothetical protein JHK85_014332 [Glycine max]|nr:hypothetical protein JHK85_014332 [Glycine max]
MIARSCETSTTCQNKSGHTLENLKVADLILLESKSWNENLVDLSFSTQETSLIKCTPLVPQVHEDKLVWAHTADGAYTVKSTYHAIMEKVLNTDHLKAVGEWQIIWKQQIPPESR